MATKWMNPVVHFEMPAEDRDRMTRFYETTFGWKTEQLGPDMGDYVLVTTSETDKKRCPKKPGMINGGFIRRRTTGGKVLGEPMEIPGYGLYVSFFDTEGNRVSMMQPNEKWKEKAK
jgi:predicted enzyme related to lactoylglutathione lyase